MGEYLRHAGAGFRTMCPMAYFPPEYSPRIGLCRANTFHRFSGPLCVTCGRTKGDLAASRTAAAAVNGPSKGNRPSKGERKRRALARRDGNACCYCKTPFTAAMTRTIDHVVPRSKGGSDALSNLVLACAPCNSAKADALGYATAS